MRRSSAPFTTTNSSIDISKSHDDIVVDSRRSWLLSEQDKPIQFNSLTSKARKRGSGVLCSRANASWCSSTSANIANAAAGCGTSRTASQSTSNLNRRRQSLASDPDLVSLLDLLRTNDFSGQIDPLHHSQYFVDATNCVPPYEIDFNDGTHAHSSNKRQRCQHRRHSMHSLPGRRNYS